MRFFCIIMHGTAVLAQVDVEDGPNDDPVRFAAKVRQALVREANRDRSRMLSDEVLSQMADVFGDAVASQAISREGRMITVKSSGDSIVVHEGQVATIGTVDDLTCLVEIHDDEWVADRRILMNEILSGLA